MRGPPWSTRRAAEERAFAELRDQLIARGKRRYISRKVENSEEYRRRVGEARVAFDESSFFRYSLSLREAIEAHAVGPPVIFFRKYVDPWTTAAALQAMHLLAPHGGEPLGELVAPFLAASGSRSGYSGPICTALFTPTERGRLKAELEAGLAFFDPGNPDRGIDWFERRQLYQALAECAASWEELLEAQEVEAAIFLAFQSVGGCWLDEEVTEAVRRVPAWLDGLEGPLD